jgi:hypothetical protein
MDSRSAVRARRRHHRLGQASYKLSAIEPAGRTRSWIPMRVRAGSAKWRWYRIPRRSRKAACCSSTHSSTRTSPVTSHLANAIPNVSLMVPHLLPIEAQGSNKGLIHIDWMIGSEKLTSMASTETADACRCFARASGCDNLARLRRAARGCREARGYYAAAAKSPLTACCQT